MRRAAAVHAGDAPAPAVEVAHQVAGELGGRVDLDVHHRLEDRGPGARHRVAEREPARHLERQLVAVHGVVGAVVDGHLEVDHREAGEVAAQPGLLDALLDGRDELPRDGAAEDVVLEREVGAARQRLHADLAVAELPVAARLLLVPAVRLGAGGDRLAVGDARQLQVHVDAEAALQLRDGHLDVQLALAREQQFLGLRVARVADRRVLFHQARQRLADLVLVAAALRLDRIGQQRLGEGDGRERRPLAPLSASTSLVSVSFSLATAPMSPAFSSVTCVCCLPCSTSRWPRRSCASLVSVEDRRVGLQRAADDAEHRDAAGERRRRRSSRRTRRRARRRRPRRAVGSPAPRGDGRERPLGRRRQVGQHGVEQRLHADVEAAGGGQQREDLAGEGRLRSPATRSSCESVPGLEELLHQGVVGLGHHLDQRVARGLRGVGVAGGDVAGR